MLFNLSLKNIKKSLKDYSIYFFTLVIAVAIFYVFNSLDAQESMIIMNESEHETIQSITQVLGYVSVFVSIILGFLIIYSNNFLIKRRKKEIGLYLTLGMSKRKVSQILVFETLLVGLISLVVGLLIGVFLSQGLSVVTAKMFEADLSTYKFIFSSQALYKTILYFGIIFLLVMIFNVITLSKYKLIDLLTAGKKNEKVKFRNKYVLIISFILSICLIGYAYKLLFDDALFMLGKEALIMIICGSIGTLLFFFSLAGFALTIIKKIKRIYFKDLNMFNLKQINNKINTSVISTTIISLMLLLTIGILATSISLANVYNADLSQNNPADFTLYHNNEVYDNAGLLEEKPNLDNITRNEEFKHYVKEYVKYDVYNIESINFDSLLNEKSKQELYEDYGTLVDDTTPIKVIKESAFKQLMIMFNMDVIDIDTNEYLFLANIETVLKYCNPAYESGNTITVDNKTLTPGSDKILEIGIENYNSSGNDGIIVLSDELLENKEIVNTILIGNYQSEDKEETEEEFLTFLTSEGVDEVLFRTKIGMEQSSASIRVLMTYVGLYLGIIFAISSVTVLAIGELSSSSDNKERYKTLKQIGASNKMINKALFIQIFITFMLPLTVALIHSFFAIREISTFIEAMGNIDILNSIIITSIFIVIVYGGYFLATYLCSKSIIKD